MNRLQKLTLVVVACMSVLARAQAAPAGDISIAITYTGAHSGLIGGSSNFWTQGGSIETAGSLSHGFGAVAKVTGLHSSNTGQGVPTNLVTAAFGPRYTWVHHKARASTEIS